MSVDIEEFVSNLGFKEFPKLMKLLAEKFEKRRQQKKFGIAYGGTLEVVRSRLKTHYNASNHSHKPGGAASDGATTFYNTSISSSSTSSNSSPKPRSLATFFSPVRERGNDADEDEKKD